MKIEPCPNCGDECAANYGVHGYYISCCASRRRPCSYCIGYRRNRRAMVAKHNIIARDHAEKKAERKRGKD